MNAALESIVTDTSLTPGACRLVLFVATLGEGEHEIAHARFAALLNHPGEKKLRSDLRVAEELGYLERTPGGRDHHDRYALSPALTDTLSDSPALQVGGYRHSPATLGAPYKDSPPPGDTLSDLGCRSGAPYGGTVGGGQVEEMMLEGEEGGARATLDPKAAEAIERHGEKLAGCRGALRDYLAQRVHPPRQYAYVQKIAGWLDGLDPSVFRRPDGTTLPSEGRTALLADALNDLAASDERCMKRPAGEPANLRTKISVLLAQRCDPPGRGTGADDGLSAADRRVIDMRRRLEREEARA